MKKILVTGGNGRFANELKKIKSAYKFLFKNKKQLNILSPKSIEFNIGRYKPNIILHLAGLSRPMSVHDTDINKSIDLNIIGTSNLVKSCNRNKIKIIFFSTSYVYPGKKGNYKEYNPLLPFNNYAWSKLGGECAVQMLKNSLILRICMTEKPFLYKYAYTNLKTNFMFHQDLVKVFFKFINKRGVINVGGPVQSVYNFAKKSSKNVKKKVLKPKKGTLPLASTMNIRKFKKIN